jgi:hypothetical protein
VALGMGNLPAAGTPLALDGGLEAAGSLKWAAGLEEGPGRDSTMFARVRARKS